VNSKEGVFIFEEMGGVHSGAERELFRAMWIAPWEVFWSVLGSSCLHIHR